MEKELLLLPSDLLAKTTRKKYDLDAKDDFFTIVKARHCTIEFRLREGQCNEAVQMLCVIIEHGMLLKETRTQHARGVSMNLRSMKYINTVTAKKQKYANAYAHARRCILRLKGQKEDPDFPPLAAFDLWAKNAAEAPGLGDGSIEESWIWTYGHLRTLNSDEKSAFIEEGRSPN